MSANPIHVVLLGYADVQTLDLAGPLDAFASANLARPGAYRTLTASLDGAPFASESGLRIAPDAALHDVGAIDTLIVPGGAGLRTPAVYEKIAQARATTHWRFADDVATRFPALRLECDRIFIKDGPLYTSAGITAAIDLALALIDEDYGPRLALTVARDLVVYLKRSGGQRQFSEPLQFQARAGDRFADLAAWIASHLSDDLSVEQLAARAALSPRQFSRRFTQAFGQTPSDQIEALRLDAARDHLTGSRAQVESIAAAVGFRSNDAFRRAFDRRFGLSPTEYRQRFPPTPLPHAGDHDVDVALS